MSTFRILLKAAVPVLVAGCTLLAQTAIAPMSANRLVNSIGLDRSVYFPGEAAVLTLTAQNLGSTPIQVSEPSSGCFELSRVSPVGVLIPLYARPVCPSRTTEPSGSMTVLGAGENLQVAMSGDDLWPGASGSRLAGTAGYYQIAQNTSGASAVFRIAMPKLEAATAVRLQDIVYFDTAARREVRAPAYMHVFSLRWNNQSYLCIALSPSTRDKAVSTDGAGNVVAVNVPYRRLATVPGPVTSVAGTANAQDNLAISWLDNLGSGQTVLVASGSRDSAVDAVEVGLDSTYERIHAAETQQFSASVAGTANRSVTWSVSLLPGAPAGAQPGAVSAAGVYTAPAGVAAPYAVLVTAQSQADPSRSAFGVVSLAPQNQNALAAAGGGGLSFAAKPPATAMSSSEPRP